LYPKEGPVTYVPTIYGFKIFGQRGSKYEIQYDHTGNTKNQKEIESFLKKKIPTGSEPTPTNNYKAAAPK
jgi:hypothetical protein